MKQRFLTLIADLNQGEGQGYEPTLVVFDELDGVISAIAKKQILDEAPK